MGSEEMGAEEKQRLPFTASHSRIPGHDAGFRGARKSRTRRVLRTVIIMKIFGLILVAVAFALSACSNTQPCVCINPAMVAVA
jgi:hypothetical protein